MYSLNLQGEDLALPRVRAQVEETLRTWQEGLGRELKKVLLLPPDFTRYHSGAGVITQLLCGMFAPACQVDIMPALGTHLPLSEEERTMMFGAIPADRFFTHDWRRDLVQIGEVPSSRLAEFSGGLVDYPVKVEINKRLMEKSYDLIVSIGQVVPAKWWGWPIIIRTSSLAAGARRSLTSPIFRGGLRDGTDHGPGLLAPRRSFDYAEAQFLGDLPLQYILTVTTAAADGGIRLHGLFIGRERRVFEAAVRSSQEHNLILLDRPLPKAVVYLDPVEFKSTWLGNKAVYRLRMAVADGGELIIIAPGVRQFGEDKGIDRLIRKYGYAGRDRILELVKEQEDLRRTSAAAHHPRVLRRPVRGPARAA